MKSKIPFCIRIGVTGHRHLPDEKALSKTVQRVLCEFSDVIRSIQEKRKPPDNNQPPKQDIFNLFDKASRKAILSAKQTPITLSILTPLAEGADRLIAKEALKLPGSRLEVVLPLAKEDYRKDFETEASCGEFEALQSRARRPVALRKTLLRKEFTDDEQTAIRRQAYAEVGRYVVQHSDLLIAIWDGQESGGIGGTADIIEYAKKRRCPVIHISTVYPHKISIFRGTD